MSGGTGFGGAEPSAASRSDRLRDRPSDVVLVRPAAGMNTFDSHGVLAMSFGPPLWLCEPLEARRTRRYSSQQRLAFLPLPQGHGSLRPTFTAFTTGFGCWCTSSMSAMARLYSASPQGGTSLLTIPSGK